MRRAASAALAAAFVSAAPLRAAAQPQPIQYDLRVDGAIALGTWAAYVGAEASKSHLAPSTCRWCDPPSLDAKVREALVWRDVAPARRASDVLGFAVIPVAMVTHQVLAARAAGDTSEAAGIAMDLNQLVKFSVGRQRPFVHYKNYDDPNRAPDPDDNLSFFSGHTTFTFAVAAAAGTISDLRGYKSAPWVWGVGMTLATATGYLRIAGDKHYLTDVLVGAATGLAAGIAIPRLAHPREQAPGSPAPAARVSFTAIPLGIAGEF
jgi:membrane-associated phospholipid phosphatase